MQHRKTLLRWSLLLAIALSACDGGDRSSERVSGKATPANSSSKQVPRRSVRSSANGLTVRSSVYSEARDSLLGRGDAKGKPLLISAPDDAKRADALCLRIAAADKAVLLAILEEINGLDGEALAKVAGALISKGDSEVKGRALALLEGYDSPLLIPLALNAFADADVDVRLEALEVARVVSDTNVLAVFQAGLSDKEADVRVAAVATGASRTDEVYERVILEAAQSPFGDVALAGLNHLRAPTKIGQIDLLISGLGHSDPLVRDLAHEILFMTFQADLKSPEAAKDWWSRKQSLFDANLMLKDPSTAPLLEAP